MRTVIHDIVEDNDNAGSVFHVSFETPAIVVVGAGPVGVHFVNELDNKRCSMPVVIYGNEPWVPYDRVRLSSYLAGEVERSELNLNVSASSETCREFRSGCAIVSIDRNARTVSDADGNVQRYSHLVMATGSNPYIPFMGNSHYDGIYTFRSLAEADELLARQLRTRHVVVIGGGLLGLETARAMQKYNTKITIIEHNRWLMMQQLDEAGGELLKNFVRRHGIYVELGESVINIIGNGRVEAVNLRSGREIVCDTVIVAAGIRPNIDLAKEAGIAYGKGIHINNFLRTSDEHIYAIGECAEHNNGVYGLVRPGLEQASVLADRLAGGYAQYVGTLESARLKVMEHSVFSVGRTGVDEEAGSTVREYVYRDNNAFIYRKIRVFGNRIIGAMAVGEWHESALVQDAVQKRRHIWLWHLLRFKCTGYIWGNADNLDVASWPSAAVVCNCTGVTRGRLSLAINAGCQNMHCLTMKTRAGSICGSCKPLLAEMIGERTTVEAVRSWRGLLVLSAIVLSIVAVFILASPVPYASSVQAEFEWDVIWRDSLYKQISGFSILGLIVAGFVVSIRKRVRKITFGDYSVWRMAHIVLGIGALLALIVHTGFRLGSELNFLLLINFLMLAAAGAFAGKVVASEHRMVPAIAKKQRRRWNWMHLLLFWPLPVLLGFHIIKTYYF